ncbi:MAG: Ig-like domain-containing protein [Eubacteriales bacterium]
MIQNSSGGGWTVKNTAPDIPEALRTITVENDTACGGIIDTDSVFRITTAKETSASELARCLRVTPDADWEITGEGMEFLMRPRTALLANTLYRFTVAEPDNDSPALLTPASFVFQTADTPRITGTFPADYAEGVPADTGLELYFSGVLDAEAPYASLISIEPSVPFRTEVYGHGKTLVIVPTQKLDAATAYTVTVQAGVAFADGRSTAEKKRFTFRVAETDEAQQLTLGYDERELVCPVGERASFHYYIYGADGDPIAAEDTLCVVYRYPDAAAAAEALLAYEQKADGGWREFVFPTDSLEKVGVYTLPTENSATSVRYGTQPYSVTLPELERGCYLVSFTASGSSVGQDFALDGQVIVQVTDITAATAAAGEDLILWVHNGGAPMSDAPVTAYLYDRVSGWCLRERGDGAKTVESASAVTDGEGLCRLRTAQRGCALAVIGEGADSRYLCIGNGSTETASRRVYVYTDREEYFQTDTVRFWGVVTPADGLDSLRCTSNAASGCTVAVSPDGTFSGSLPYADYAGYGVSLSFAAPDGASLASVYKSISHEEKPVYTAFVTMDQPFYRRGASPCAELSVSFFDGTPAGGLRFAWNAGEFGSGEAVTDEAGIARVTLNAGALSPRSTAPLTGWVNFELIGDEASSLRAHASFLYFHSDVILETEQAEDGVQVSLWQLDTSALTDAADYYRLRDALKGESAAGEITYSLVRSWTERIVTGTRYDPITKRTEELIRTERHEETLGSAAAAFTDGRLLLPYVDEPRSDSSYTYLLTYRDGAYTYTYRLNAVRPVVRTPLPEEEPYVLTASRADGSNAGEGSGSFAPGESVTLTVQRGGVIPAQGRTLFVYMNPDGVVSVRLAAQTDTVAFDGALSPYSRAAALYFDGRETAAALTYDMLYDYAARNQLTLSVEPESERCLPGAQLGVTVRVTDAEGNAAVGAQVLLSVTDEAAFALCAQQLEPDTPLAALIRFRQIGSAVDARYSILNPPYRMPVAYAKYGMFRMAAAETADCAAPAEAANGGSSVYVRQEFADNAFFSSAVSGEDGCARFSVRIPDNITTWRLSAVACAPSGETETPVNVSMGASKGAVVCTLPFFVSASLNSLYISGDDIALNARCSGTGKIGTARFTAALTDSAGTELASLTGEGGQNETVRFSFGKLPAGEYEVTIAAYSGELADAVRHSFTVVDSAILLPVNRVLSPAEAAHLSPVLYPLTLCFFDASDSLICRTVDSLLYAQNGRLDAKAAALAAFRICEKLSGSCGIYADEIGTLSGELNRISGGCRLYSWAEEDPVLTAKICLLSADVLSYSAVQSYAEYLTGVLAATEEGREAAAALMGLAALGQPVLGDLRYARSRAQEFCGADDVARLYLAAAFAVLGDRDAASELYTECARVLRVEDADGVYFRGSTAEETLELSYAALLCASLTDGSEAGALMEYLSDRASAYEMYVLEQAVYAAAYAPDAVQEKEFTYVLDGVAHTEKLNGRRPFVLTLNRDTYASFAVTAADEDIRVRALYTGTPGEACASAAENISVNKTVEPCEGKTNFYRVTVTVTGSTDKTSYSASLTDRLPSGARFVRLEKQSFTGSARTYGWLWEDGGQVRGTLCVCNPAEPSTAGRSAMEFTASYSYIIRAYTPGEFVCESAYLVENGSGAFAASERTGVTFD